MEQPSSSAMGKLYPQIIDEQNKRKVNRTRRKHKLRTQMERGHAQHAQLSRESDPSLSKYYESVKRND